MFKFLLECKQEWLFLKYKVCLEKIEVDKLLDNRSMIRLINVLITAEDHRFKYHLGFDVIAICRAIRNNMLWNKREGASTIEQQLVRVLTNSYEKSLYRKLKEILLACLLKFFIDKKRIVLIYLNVAYYGTNLVGLDKILQRFNLNKSDYLTEDICAEVVARLKYPEPLKKDTNKKNKIERRKNYILRLYYKHSVSKIIKGMSNIKLYLKLTPEALSVKNIYEESENFKDTYRTLASIELSSYIRHIFVDNTPYMFREMPLLYKNIIFYIAEELDLKYHEILLIGSAKTGFSMSPESYGEKFSEERDLDFTIINKRLFEDLKIEFELWENMYMDSSLIPRGREKEYWDDNLERVPKNLDRGFIDSNKIPNKESFKRVKQINQMLYLILYKLGEYYNIRNKKASVRVYKNEECFQKQLMLNTKYIISCDRKQ